MFLIMIDEATCKGCGDCVENCPASILSLNGDNKAEVTGDLSECLGCESCVTVCETASITMQEV
jgi:NAD-dependent dihydropyrimidine dehydrogenase PreA subunit